MRLGALVVSAVVVVVVAQGPPDDFQDYQDYAYENQDNLYADYAARQESKDRYVPT